LFIAQGGDDDIGPEARPVAPKTPAFILEAASLTGDSELALQLAGSDILRRIKDGEMLADDFVGPVFLDALGAGIPAGDVAMHVEGEDRVVDDILDDAAER